MIQNQLTVHSRVVCNNKIMYHGKESLFPYHTHVPEHYATNTRKDKIYQNKSKYNKKKSCNLSVFCWAKQTKSRHNIMQHNVRWVDLRASMTNLIAQT